VTGNYDINTIIITSSHEVAVVKLEKKKDNLWRLHFTAIKLGMIRWTNQG